MSNSTIAHSEAQQKNVNEVNGMKDNGWTWYVASFVILIPLMVNRKGLSNARLFFSNDTELDYTPFQSLRYMVEITEIMSFGAEGLVAPYWGSFMDRYGCGGLLIVTWLVAALSDYLISWATNGVEFFVCWIICMITMCTGDAIYQTMFRSFGNFMDPQLKQFWSYIWLIGNQLGGGSAGYWVHFTSTAPLESRWRSIFRYVQCGSAIIFALIVVFFYPWAIDNNARSTFRQRASLKSGKTSPIRVAFNVQYAKRVCIACGLTRALKYVFLLKLPALLNQALQMEKQDALYASSYFEIGGTCFLICMALYSRSKSGYRQFRFAFICGATYSIGLCLILACLASQIFMFNLPSKLLLIGVASIGSVNAQDLMLGKNSPLILERRHQLLYPDAPNCAQSLRGLNYSSASVSIVLAFSGQSFLTAWFKNLASSNPVYEEQVTWTIMIGLLLICQVIVLSSIYPVVKAEKIID